MGCRLASNTILFYASLALCALCQRFAYGVGVDQNATLIVDASGKSSQPIPDTMFGIFLEEINHAGAGGIWAELVSNRGFEAGGPNTPSNIDPWSIIGNDSLIIVSTDRSSPFSRNEVALRMDILCDNNGSNICPPGGVGIYNPGYWGMNIEQGKKYNSVICQNIEQVCLPDVGKCQKCSEQGLFCLPDNIEQGKKYKVVLHVRSTDSVSLSISLTSSNGSQELATGYIT